MNFYFTFLFSANSYFYSPFQDKLEVSLKLIGKLFYFTTLLVLLVKTYFVLILVQVTSASLLGCATLTVAPMTSPRPSQ